MLSLPYDIVNSRTVLYDIYMGIIKYIKHGINKIIQQTLLTDKRLSDHTHTLAIKLKGLDFNVSYKKRDVDDEF